MLNSAAAFSIAVAASAASTVPSHVAFFPADKVRGLANSEVVRGFADTLSAAPLTYSLRRSDADFILFCFTKPEDADAFCQRFEGERCST
jgi:hypothetical protein